MNGSVLAALAAAALIAIILVLRQRAARKKSSQEDITAPLPELTAPAPEPLQVGGEPEPAPEEAAAVPASAAEDDAAIQPETTAVIADVPSGDEPVAGGDEPVTIAEHLEPEAEPSVEEDAAVAVGEEEPVAAAFQEEPHTEAITAGAETIVTAPAAGIAEPVIHLTLEVYTARLNRMEDRQRALLAEAIARQDDDERDCLQRELVLMNDKLALVADNYVEEIGCYQQVLAILERLRGESGLFDGIESAIARLRGGEPEEAAAYLAGVSAQPGPCAAQAAYGSGCLAESRVELRPALASYRQAVEREPENPAFLLAAGRVARNLYRYGEAIPWFESHVQLVGQLENREPLALALAQRELAYTYVLSGQHPKAGPLYKEAMTVLAAKLGQDHPEMAISWLQIGELQETLGEYDKALSLYKKALAILEKKRGVEHPVLAGILAKLAGLCMELELEQESVPLYERLVSIREKTLRPNHPQLAISLNSLAESYRLQGRHADAEPCYLKILAINESIHGPEHPSVAAVLQELAKLSAALRKPEDAKAYQERAAAIFQKSVEASERKSDTDALALEL